MVNDRLALIYLIQDGEGPWQVVSKEAWVNYERVAGFHNTMGQPSEPSTAGFTSSRGGVQRAGRIADPAYYNPSQYADDPQLRDIIEIELAMRQAVRP